MSSMLKRFWEDESGQGLVEYVLIIALVAIGLIAVMIVFRDAIGRIFDTIAGRLDGAPGDGFEPGGGTTPPPDGE
jgi:pilus assembly protein Flp/PilA